MKHGSFKVHYRPIPDINVTSLVDVTLVLLIIFMVAAPIMKNTLNIEVPQAVTAKPNDKDGITIIVQKNGKISINDVSTDEERFDADFSQMWNPQSSEPVFLKADGGVPYAKVLTIVDALREVGVVDLGLVAEPGESRHGRRR